MNASTPARQPELQPRALSASSGSSGRRYTGMVIQVPRPSPILAERNAHDCAIDGGQDEEVSKKRKRDSDIPLDIMADLANAPLARTNATKESDLLLVLPEDVQYVTDFHLLLYAQVRRSPSTKQDWDTGLRSKGKKLQAGFMGLRCRHCGGNGRGSYFPSSPKHLQSCSNNIFNHLKTCKFFPANLKRALNRAKVAHQREVLSKPKGAQSVWFPILFERIHSEAFAGARGQDLQLLVEMLDKIVEQSAPAPALGGLQATFPSAVSYEETGDDAMQLEADTVPTAEDFEVALDLLRGLSPETDMNFYDESLANLNVTPAPVSLATAASSSSELYQDDWALPYLPQPKKKKSKYHDTPGRRKFSRSEEILLIRGMMRHGEKGKWKKIWDGTPALQHIKHCALKDRARSNRFLKILERAKRDPSLLDRPDELCGKAESSQYLAEN